MTFFINFWLNQIQNCFGQIKKMRDGIFSFQLKKKYFCRTLTDNARHKMYPFPLIWLESWNHTMKGILEVNSGENRSDLYNVRWIARLDWSKTAKQFSVNARGKFLNWHEVSGQVDSSFPLLNRYFSTFWLVISVNYVVLFFLGKCLLDS